MQEKKNDNKKKNIDNICNFFNPSEQNNEGKVELRPSVEFHQMLNKDRCFEECLSDETSIPILIMEKKIFAMLLRS